MSASLFEKQGPRWQTCQALPCRLPPTSSPARIWRFWRHCKTTWGQSRAQRDNLNGCAARQRVELLQVIAEEQRQAADDGLPRQVGGRKLVRSCGRRAPATRLQRTRKQRERGKSAQREAREVVELTSFCGLADARAMRPPPPASPCSSECSTCNALTASPALSCAMTMRGSSARLYSSVDKASARKRAKATASCDAPRDRSSASV